MTKEIGNGANIGFENQLWAVDDKLRGHMNASEYKHVVLGLIFLKYISDAFQARHNQLEATKDTEYIDPQDRDKYAAANIFWVPKEALRISDEVGFFQEVRRVGQSNSRSQRQES
jgi:type I restriction enzyme M protein